MIVNNGKPHRNCTNYIKVILSINLNKLFELIIRLIYLNLIILNIDFTQTFLTEMDHD